MSDGRNIVTCLLEDDDLDPKEFIDQSADTQRFDLRPYTDPDDVLRAVQRWRSYCGYSGSSDTGYTIDFTQSRERHWGNAYWHAMLDLKPGRVGNLVIVYMFIDAQGDEWEIERMEPQALAQAYAELDPLVRAFIKKLRTVAVFNVQSSRFVNESDEDFDPADEVDRLTPASKIKARLVPGDKSTIKHPSWVVLHPFADVRMGTVQYAPLYGDDKPWAANPDGMNNDVVWCASKDEAVAYVASFWNIKESDEDFDPKDEADRLTGPITQEQLAAWMTEAGFYDFSFYSQHRDGKPYFEVRGYATGKMLETIEKLEAFLESKRLHVFKGRVTRQAVNIDHPAQITKRSIWFLLPLEHIAPDPPRHVSEDEKDDIMQMLPNRPRSWGDLPPGTLVYDEEGWMVIIIGEKHFKDWAMEGPGFYINTTECSPCYAYGRFEQRRHIKNQPLPRCIRILGPQGDQDPWALLKQINDQREQEEKADGGH